MIIIVLLLIGFLLNVINHGNLLIGILNILLLSLSIYFYLDYTSKNFGSINSPYFILIAAIPLFTYNHDIFILFLTFGIILLLILYSNTRLKGFLVLIIGSYLVVASLYANGIIHLPFSLQSSRFIFSDDWNNLYISRMQNEALYMPYKLRLLIFNSSVYFYVLFSKLAGLFTFKNLYDVLLLANLYPLAKGLILDLKNWNRSKTFIILCVLIISSVTVSSRTVDIFNTFMLLAPFLMYFILRGFNFVNKITYLILFILSIVIATSPYK